MLSNTAQWAKIFFLNIKVVLSIKFKIFEKTYTVKNRNSRQQKFTKAPQMNYVKLELSKKE